MLLIRAFKFASFCMVVSFSMAVVGVEKGDAAGTESIIESVLPEFEDSDLGKNLKLLENYYQQVDEKLNSQLQRGARDPFQQLVLPPERPSDTYVEQSRQLSGQSKITNSSLSGASSKAMGKGSVMRPLRGRNDMLPVMQFRGFMRVEGMNAALLDIVGVGSVIVKVGDKVGVGRMDGGDETVIRIVEISTLNVTVEVGSLGERVVVQ